MCELAREISGQRRGKDSCALGVEVYFIRLVIVNREYGRIHGNQCFDANFSRSQHHLVNRIRGGRSGGNEDDQFRAVRCAELLKTFEAGIRNGGKLRRRGNGRLRLQEQKKFPAMRNSVAKKLHSENAARIPKHAGVGEQQITGLGIIKVQVVGDVGGVFQVKEHERRIILAHTVGKKAVYTYAKDDDVGPRSFTEQALQGVEPIVVSGGFKKNRMNAELAGS